MRHETRSLCRCTNKEILWINYRMICILNCCNLLIIILKNTLSTLQVNTASSKWRLIHWCGFYKIDYSEFLQHSKCSCSYANEVAAFVHLGQCVYTSRNSLKILFLVQTILSQFIDDKIQKVFSSSKWKYSILFSTENWKKQPSFLSYQVSNCCMFYS